MIRSNNITPNNIDNTLWMEYDTKYKQIYLIKKYLNAFALIVLNGPPNSRPLFSADDGSNFLQFEEVKSIIATQPACVYLGTIEDLDLDSFLVETLQR